MIDADTAQWQKTAALLKTADKKVSAAMRKALREVAKPIGDKVGPKGAEKLPHAGGLSAYLAGSVKPTVSLTGKDITIKLQGKARSGKPTRLKALDAGKLRHPVFGLWLKDQEDQAIPANAFSDAFLAEKDEAVKAVQQAVQKTLTNLEAGSE